MTTQRLALVAKLTPIAWMLSNDPVLLSHLHSSAVTLMRLEGLRSFAAEAEHGELIECGACGKTRQLVGFSLDEGWPLCGECFA